MSAAILLLAAVPAAPPPAADVSVPPGFVATLFADNALAPDIYTMALDDAGRVLVAGRGYVRVLEDADGDGVADKAIDLIEGLQGGPMGLLAEGDTLFVVVDGGLKRYTGYDGKSKLKQPPETLLKLKTTGEHDAHAVRRGPDGWLYLLCGNMAGVTKDTVTSPLSPVKEPVAGALLRISPQASGGREPAVVEVVADGFRNAYSFDFNLDGEPFTYDSDNERCVGLPWYEPCRFYHVVPGGNYGWRSPQLGQFWRKPPYFIDCVPPVCYTGRGSPTGVAGYRHTHFPEKYRGGFFLADWTFGRIHYVPLTAKDSTYAGKPEVFAEAVGTSGFAPTALAVHPKTGELFVSIGGRGTRGGVYRIAHAKNPAGKSLEMATRSLEWTAADNKRWLADCTSADARHRRTTLELMLRAGAKLAWSPKLTDAVKPNLSHADPLVRMAAARTIGPLVVPLGSVFDDQARLMIAFADLGKHPEESLGAALAILERPNGTEAIDLQAIRIVQLIYGDLTDDKSRGTVFEGYSLRKPLDDRFTARLEVVSKALLRWWDKKPNTETLRTFAALSVNPNHTFRRAVSWLTPAATVQDDISNLALLATIDLPSNETEREVIVTALIDLERKAIKQKVPRDTFWPLRVSEIVTALGKRHPKLAEAVLEHPGFGRPEHLLLVNALNIPRLDAAKRFLATAATERGFTWTPGVVEIVGLLEDDTSRLVLEKLWERTELQPAIVAVFAKRPKPQDAEKFVAGLGFFDAETVRRSAMALADLAVFDGKAELVAGVKALRRLDAQDKAARGAVAEMLQKRTGMAFGPDPKPWTEWFVKNNVSVAKLLAQYDGFDAAAWKKREADIAFDKGDAVRGREVFAKASCAACHDGGRALGPSLLGVTKRFSREDLATAIVQPNKDVPARYRATRVTTTDEKAFVGIMIYEAQDGIILQTNADTSVRLAGETIVSKRPVETSLMPAGLLDKLTNAEVADLFAYLKTLEEKPAKP